MTDVDTLGFWSRVRLGSLLPYVIAGAALLVAILVAGKEIDNDLDVIEAWIDRTSPWGIVVFFALYVVLSSAFVPSTALSIISGAMFGVAGGTLAVVVGALAAASLQYFLGHRLMRSWIERAISKKPSLLAIKQAVHRREVRLQLLLRLTPLNAAMTSYVLGAAGVRFTGYLLACLALIPGLFLQVYFGYAGKHVADMAGRDTQTVVTHDAVILGGLLACIVVMVVVARAARKAVQAKAHRRATLWMGEARAWLSAVQSSGAPEGQRRVQLGLHGHEPPPNGHHDPLDMKTIGGPPRGPDRSPDAESRPPTPTPPHYFKGRKR